MFFLLSRLFFKRFLWLAKLRQVFPVTATPHVFGSRQKLLMPRMSVSWKVTKVSGPCWSNLVSFSSSLFFFKMLCWYTYINLVGTFPSKHQINWQQLYKKATVFAGIGYRFFGARLFCGYPLLVLWPAKKKTLGSWCFLSSFQGFTKKSPMTPCKG